MFVGEIRIHLDKGSPIHEVLRSRPGDAAIAHLAKADDQINAGIKAAAAVATEAEEGFAALGDELPAQELASRVYALFTTGTRASKAIAAQYLAERFEKRVADGELINKATNFTLQPQKLNH